MQERGELSREEFDAARASVTARLAGREPESRGVSAPRASDGGVALRAKPGFDLAGDPLPGAGEGGGEHDTDDS
jgi:hypothetical protein